MDKFDYRSIRDFPYEDVIHLYKENKWSSANKPELLIKALSNSSTLVSAWKEEKIIGVGNAISDGYLVVYYPHLLVLPDYQGKGIGREILRRLKDQYSGFHQHIIVAEANAFEFYKSEGFSRAGNTVSMWIYSGEDH